MSLPPLPLPPPVKQAKWWDGLMPEEQVSVLLPLLRSLGPPQPPDWADDKPHVGHKCGKTREYIRKWLT